ncbi:MAG TPA: endonuclease domain-containing protein, partial [Burkholderiales bacterium]
GGRGDSRTRGNKVLPYNRRLKQRSRILRRVMTDAEQLLWMRLRRKQLSGVQFYRQKPLGNYVVEFYAPQAKIVVEVDGSQHLEPPAMKADAARDKYLSGLGFDVLRFDNLQVLRETESVLDTISRAIAKAEEE